MLCGTALTPATAADLDLGGLPTTLTTLKDGASVDWSNIFNGILTVDTSAGDIAFGGRLMENFGGINSLSLIKNTAGILMLNNGGSTYAGGTLLSAGTIVYSASSTLTAGPLGIGAITLAGGTLSPNSNRTLSNQIIITANSGFLGTGSLSGNISGAGTLLKDVSGILTLSGNNAGFSGGINLNAGGIYGSNGNSFGTGNITVGLTAVSGVIIGVTGATVDLNLPATTNIVLNNNKQVNFALPGAGHSITVNGTISGSGTILLKSGLGTLILPNASNYTGSSNILSGFFGVGNNASISGTINATGLGGIKAYADGLIISNKINASAPFSIDTRGFGMTYTGTHTGVGSFTKTGAGTLFVTPGPANTTTYSGGTILAEGTLSIAADSSLGAASGGLTFTGGSLQITGTTNSTTTRSVTLASATGTFDIAAATNLYTLNQAITGAGALGKTGAGTLILGAANNYAGGTTIDQGTLEVANTGALGSGAVTLTGGTLETGLLSLSLANNFTLGSAGHIAVDGGVMTIAGQTSDAIGDVGVLRKTGVGTLVLTNAGNVHSGGTVVEQGILQVAADEMLGAPGSALTLGLAGQSGGTLAITGSFASDRTLVLANTGTIDTGAASVDWTGQITGPGQLAKTGSGVLALFNTANNFTGGIALNAGTLALKFSNVTGSGAITATNGVIDYADGIDVTNPIVLQGSGLQLQTMGGAEATQSGAISESGGSWGVEKIGAGTLDLLGANSFSGGLTLSAGSLNIDNDAGVGTGTLTLAGGTIIGSFADVVLANNVVLSGGDATVAGTMTFDGIVSGPGQFHVTCCGLVSLTNSANSFSGGVLDGGQLAIGSNGALGAAGNLVTLDNGSLQGLGSFTIAHDIVINNSGSLVASAGETLGVSGLVSGPGPLTIYGFGNGTVSLENLGNSQLYTFVSEANLQIAGDGALGGPAANLYLADNAALRLAADWSSSRQIFLFASSVTIDDQGHNATFAGNISDFGFNRGFTKAGAGTLTLDTADSYAGGTNVTGGTVVAGNNAALGTGIVTLGNGTTLGVDTDGLTLANAIEVGVSSAATIATGANTLTLSGQLISDNASSLAKTGSGTLALTGASGGFGGLLDVQGGTVDLQGSIGGTLNVGAGTTLSGTGSAGDVIVTGNGVITPGGNTAGTLSFTSLTLNPSAILNFNLGAANDLLSVSGASALGGVFNIAADGGFGTGTYIIVAGGLAPTGSLTLGLHPFGFNYFFGLSGNDYVLNVTDGSIVNQYWNQGGNIATGDIVGGSGVWNDTNSNWTETGFEAETWLSRTGIFQAPGGTVTVVGAKTFEELDFRSNGYVLVGDDLNATAQSVLATDAGVTATVDNNITGINGLHKLGAGTLVLGGVNSFTGTFAIDAGIVGAGNGQALGLGNVAMADGTTLYALAGLTIANNVAVSGTATFDANNNEFAIGGDISGGGVRIVDTGAIPHGGEVIFSGNNSYAGPTTVDAAILSIGAANNIGAGTLILNDGALRTTGSFTLGNDVLLSGVFGGFATQSGTTLVASGQVSGAELVKFGEGTLVLTNAGNNYVGGTSIQSGVLEITSDAALGGGSLAFDVDSGGTLRTDAGITSNRDIAFNVDGTIDTNGFNSTLQGNISGGGQFTKAGLGRLTLTGSNSYTGNTVVSGGALQIADGGQLGSGQLQLGIGTALVAGVALNQSFTLGNDILLVGAGGKFLNLNGSGGVGYGIDGTIFSNGTQLTLAGAITGTGPLVVFGDGIASINHANSYGGGTVISDAVVRLTDAGGLGNGFVVLTNVGGLYSDANLTMANGVTVNGSGVIGGNGDLTLTGGLNGSGTLYKVAANTLNLAGNGSAFGGLLNAWQGTTLVNGTLGSGAASVNVANGGTLGGSGTINGGVIVADGAIAPGNSPGTLTINGNLALGAPSILNYELGQANVAGGALNDRIVVTGNLTLDGTLNVAQSAGGNFGDGVYNILTYGGALTDNGLSLGSLALQPGATATLESGLDAGFVNLIVASTGFTQYWDGDNSALWHNGVVNGGDGTWTTGSATFTNATGTLNSGWQGHVGVFAGNAGFVTVNGALNFEKLVFNTSGYDFVGGGTLAMGASGEFDVEALVAYVQVGVSGGQLVKTGGGYLDLTGDNSYTGGTLLNAGIIRPYTDGALGTGTVTMASATRIDGVADVTLANNFVLDGFDQFNPYFGTTLTLNGAVSGAGTLQKFGAGTLVLGNNGNSYAGGTQLFGGTTVIADDGALGLSGTGLGFLVDSTLQTTANVTSNRNVQLAAAATIDTQGNNDVFSGAFAGGGSLTKTGSGELTLSSTLGDNSYTGGTTLAQGTLRIANGSNLGTGALATAGGTTLGAGVGLDVGTLVLANDIALGAGTTSIDLNGNSASLNLASGAFSSNGTDLVLNGTITGAGGLQTANIGSLTINGNNSYAGGTIINDAMVRIGSDNALGSGLVQLNTFAGVLNNSGFSHSVGNDIAVSGAINLAGGDSDLTLTGQLSGNGDLAKAGNGRLTLVNGGSYGGAFDVQAGELRVDGTLTNAAATVTVFGGTTLSGTGTINGTVNVADAGVLAVGDGGVGAMTFGNLNLSGTSIVNFDLGQANVIGGAFNDQIVVSGILTLDGTLNVTNSASFGLGIYNLFKYGSVVDNGLSVGALPLGYTGLIQNQTAASEINLIVSAPGTLVQYWDGGDVIGDGSIGGGAGTWNAANTNWTTDAPSSLNASWQGGIGLFQTPGGAIAVQGTQAFVGLGFFADGYTLTGGGLSMSGSSFIYVDAGDNTTIASTISGSGPLSKQGAGLLTLTGNNSYTGDTALDQGNIAVGSNTALGTGTLAMNANNSTLIAAVDGLTLANQIALNGNNYIDTQCFTFTLTGSLGGVGNLNKTGFGTLVLDAADSYGGDTALLAGTIQVGNDLALSAGALNMSTGTNLRAGGDITLANAINLQTGGSEIVDDAGSTFTLNGAINGGGRLVKTGAGNLVLNGANGYSGGTEIGQGTLTLGNNLALGSGSLEMDPGTTLAAGVSGLVVANAITLDGFGLVDSGVGQFTLAGNIGGGVGQLYKLGSGNLILSGDNSFNGLYNYTGGTLTLASNTAGGADFIALLGGSTLAAGVSGLVINNPLIYSFGDNNIDSGAGMFTINGQVIEDQITKIGSGNLVLNGNNSFNGLTINAGTVTLGSNTAGGAGGIAVNDGTTLAAGGNISTGNTIELTGATSFADNGFTWTVSGIVNGIGSLAKTGSGNLVLNGANNFLGGLSVNQGTATLGTNTAAGAGGIALAGGTTLAAGGGITVANAVTLNGFDNFQDNGFTWTFSGSIDGSGTLDKIGAGQLNLTGASTYSGTTEVQTGTLGVGNDGALGNSNLLLFTNTTLQALSDGLSLGNAVTLFASSSGASTIDTQGFTLTLGGAIDGGNSLSKVGGGNLVLNGANSYNGLAVNDGTVTLGTNTAAGADGISLAEGTTLAAGANISVANAIAMTGNYAVIDTKGFTFNANGVVSGDAVLEKIGSGQLNLTSANTQANTYAIQGTLGVGNNAALGTGFTAVWGGATLQALTNNLSIANQLWLVGDAIVDTQANTMTLTGGVTFFGSLNKTGSGQLNLTAASDYSGDTVINAGTIGLGDSAALSTGAVTISAGGVQAIANNLSVANDVVLNGNATVDTQAFTLTMGGGISGGGGLTKTGTGLLTYTGTATYTGATNVAAGTLSVQGSLGLTAVTVQSGATLAGGGSIAGGVTILDGGTLSPGGAPGTLTVGALTLSDGSLVNYDLGEANVVAGLYNDLTIVNGDLTLDGTLAVTNSHAFGNGFYELFSYNGALTDNGLDIGSLPGGASGTIQTVVPGQVNLLVFAPGTFVQYWDGADGVGNGTISGGSGVWNAGNANWTGASPSQINGSWLGDVAVFQGAAGDITVQGAQAFKGLQFTTSGYTIGADATGSLVTDADGSAISVVTGGTATINAPITGTGQIAKQGGGALVLGGDNSYSGGTDLQSGTIGAASGTALGTGTLTMAGGTGLFNAGGTITLANAIVVNGAAQVDSASGTFTLGGAVSGAGAVTKVGSGNLVLNGANSFAGGLAIDSGTVTLGTSTAAGAGAITMADQTTLAAGVSGLVVANAMTLNGFEYVDSGTGTFTLSGNIGGGQLYKVGSGNLVLSGNNSFGGVYNYTGGTLTLASNTAAGNSWIALTGNSTLAAGAANLVVANDVYTFGDNVVDTAGQTFTLTGNIYSGQLTKVGAGNLVLNGGGDYTQLTINTGTVTLGNGAAGGIGGIAVNDAATLAAGGNVAVANPVTIAGFANFQDNGFTWSLNGVIDGSGTLDKIGSGHLNLTAANSYSGTTEVQNGTLGVGNNAALGTSNLLLFTNTTLQALADGLSLGNAITLFASSSGASTIDTQAFGLTLGGVIDGGNSLTKIGAGTLTLDAVNTYTGGTLISGGTLIGSATSFGTGAVTDNAALVFAQPTDASFAPAIGGTGTVTKTGAGALTLGGVNTYAGGTTISAGTLIGSATSFGSGPITDNAALVFDQPTNATFGPAINGTGSLVKTGAGKLTLTGIGTLSGPTTVTAGNLAVNGALASSAVTVQTGATLSGTGTVGATTVNAGGTLSPGNGAPGTLTVNGALNLLTGSTYLVDVLPAGADRVNASGALTIAGNLTLGQIAPGGYLFFQTYTLAQGASRTGTFTANVATAFGPAFNTTLVYDATSVKLAFLPASIVGLAASPLTPNQAAVGHAFDTATSAGWNPQAFYNLYVQSPATIRDAFDQLSGEIHVAERRAALEDTRVVRETALDRLSGADDNATRTASRSNGDATTTFFLRAAASWGSADSDGNGHHFTTDQAGFLTGVDYQSGGWKIGGLFHYTRDKVDMAALGQGKVESTGGALFGGYRDDSGLSFGAGASVAGVHTSGSRSITTPGITQGLTWRGNGTVWQGFGEVAFDLAHAKDSRIEPFARLAYARLKMNAFNEGGGAAALVAGSQSHDLTIANLGVRGSVDAGFATLSGAISWQHTAGDRSPTTLLAITGTNQPAAINTAPLDKNAANVEAKANFRLAPNATLGVGYSGLIGSSNRDHGARATLTIGF